MMQQADYLVFAVVSLALYVGLQFVRGWNASTRGPAIVGLALLTPVLIGGWFLTRDAGERARLNIVHMLTGYAPTYAADLEALGHGQLHLGTPANDSRYVQMIEHEKRWLAANSSVNDIYTFRRDRDGTIRLMVDSETDYNRDGRFNQVREQRTPLGEVYEDDNPELAAAFAGSAGFQAVPYTDKWGTWVSAYAPMRDAQGRVEAVLGVDFEARMWNVAIRKARFSVMGYLFVFVLFVSGGVFLVSLLKRNAELAVAASRAKSEFLATMSHEIRTPMNGVSSMAALLLDSPLSAEQQEFAQIIRSSADSLVGIINDILDFSKIEAGKMMLEPLAFDFERACADVVELLSARAREKDLELSLDYDPTAPKRVVGDPVRLRQVVMNLAGNALKFTASGHVCVRVQREAGAGPNTWLRVAVEDTGIGIPPEALATIFEKFTQADGSTTRKFGGTGLGLSISRQFVELMGGQMRVTSEVGKGSSFFFTIELPIAEAEPASVVGAEAPRGLRSAQLGVHVLLVDDSEVNQRVARHLLKKFGCTMDAAGNGRIALDMLAADHAYDMVLTDCQMPEMDGYEATRELRRREAGGARLPVVAMTGSAMQGDRERCIEAGMDDYFTKPVQPAELLRVLERWGRGVDRAAA